MEKFIINGGKKLHGTVSVSGAKNVALKALVAACLTQEKVTIYNVPLISDFFVMADIIREIGGMVTVKGHAVEIHVSKVRKTTISLEKAAEIRTSSLFLAPLLARFGKAVVPNPGGCRIGARPIDRTIDGLKEMGVSISYDSDDGYFHAKTNGLKGMHYLFEKNTHTGTETLILAAVLAKGQTILKNAAEEPEIDELILLLNSMGARILRKTGRVIVIEGVEKLHGTTFTIKPDRNEIVTLAIASLMTEGDLIISDVNSQGIETFLEKYGQAGGGFEVLPAGLRFYYKGPIQSVDVVTAPYPGFMTDWQGPWAVLMTKAKGMSVIWEAVYENRFGYASELLKMGAKISLFNPQVKNPDSFYNFNLLDDKKEFRHAAKVKGFVQLHNAVVDISDLRAGATLVLAALSAKGESIVFGVEHIDRGYEQFDKRLRQLGADIKREKE